MGLLGAVMKLYVMRHAPREPSADVLAEEDGDPEADLTDEGRLIATGMGEHLAEQEEIPTTIYASPTVRTQQTADLIARAIEEAGFDPPEVKVDLTIGPMMSIRGLVLKFGESGVKKALIVSHHESIAMGLQALNVDNGESEKPDQYAAAEIRTYDVKRKSGRWTERSRVRPSDIGFSDTY